MLKRATGLVPWVLAAPLFLLTGCSSIGPKILHGDRYHYNNVMNQSNNQELLLNMVRLRYDESTMILKVGNISGSTSLQSTASLLATRYFGPINVNGTALVTGNAGGTYTDNPIISYTPLDDQRFTQAFLLPLSLANMNLLLESAWSISRVMRIGLQQVGDAYNAPSSARPTSSHVPEYQTFLDVVSILRDIQVKEALTNYYVKKDEVEELVLVIGRHYRLSAKERAVFKKAGIEVHNNKIHFTNRPAPHKVFVITRSMQGILNYLSKGLMVPPEDAKQNVLSLTTYRNGKVFDWQKVLNGMMKISYSPTPPKDAYISIFYRHRWYYVSDTDSNSKQTLILLANMAGLIQSGGSAGSSLAPALARTV